MITEKLNLARPWMESFENEFRRGFILVPFMTIKLTISKECISIEYKKVQATQCKGVPFKQE